ALAAAAALLAAAPRLAWARAWPAAAPKTVAVLYFDNNTGSADYDAMGRGVAAMLITDLSGVPDITLVERERLQNVIAEQKLQQSGYFDPSTAVRTGKLLGAEYLLTGQFTAKEPEIRIDTRVVRVETGEIVRTAKVQGKEDKFFDLQQKLAKELVKGLPIAVSPEAMAEMERRQEKNRIDDARVMVDFSQGLQRLDYGDHVGAIEKLGPLMVKAPESALFGAAYAEAKRRSGNAAKNKARDALKGALRRWP
ncbi:CsgG/HfaB family protein, partial [Roseisolibacter sp. H3M3-2]|uniref:CsgG/HfaB family protein n=1 Tax=Roseisolibacter sp. H3M3-2 TaxID=3031323 RepID=UPI0023DCC2FF